MSELIDRLASEWGAEGFFHDMRKMSFSTNNAVRFLDLVESIDVSILSEREKKDAVLALWDQPFLALAYSDRCVEAGADFHEVQKWMVEISRVVRRKIEELLDAAPDREISSGVVSPNGSKMRLPGDKFDLDAVAQLAAADFPAIVPFLDDLVAWVADGNWPVARPVADLLVSIGADAVPALRQVLQGSDAIHQHFVLLLVGSRLSPDVAAALLGDLERLAGSPTPDQVREGVSELAEIILQKLDD
ncbi:DUF5071 domain-containing protein [Rhizobium leguminosarum]|uniref:DUF5071 domain-containing protein n=1 Tax=Rhizobium leguminosarum TaxID=384 RepID=UPI0015DA7FFE|nr:DUF5071 domain-containing protein [Rhizobium leguminosarum]NZD50191.1 DUF5071 domain-containing protein [Rhizobium leguminosarum]